MGDPLNIYEVDSDLLAIRARIGEHLLKMTQLEVEDLNKLSTDALLTISWAFEEVYEKAFSLGVQSGGRDAFAIADLDAEDVADKNLLEWEAMSAEAEQLARNNKEEMGGILDRELDNEVLSGEVNDELTNLVEADAVVVDSLVQQMAAMAERFDALELQVGVKYTG